MGTLKEAALYYATEKGWPIFPCRADKTPYTSHGVHDATTNPKQIEEWWNAWPMAGIGLNVGEAGMMVVDGDPGHDMDELHKNLGPEGLPDTPLYSRTPRGGWHRFYGLGEGEIVSPSASKLAKHVDVRSFNSYVLLPPSRTGDGEYEWEEEGKPHYRTDEMVRLSNSAREKHEDRNNWLIEADLPENVELAIEWLKTEAKIAIDGQGGDHMAVATAAYMKSYAISEEMALDLMWEHWNPRCLQPWSGDQVDHFQQKVENGYAYNTSPPGNITPAYKVAKTAALFPHRAVPPDLKGHTWSRGRFRTVDRTGLNAIKKPEWLIDDMIMEDTYVMMFGAPQAFKTFLALDMALSVATGAVLDPLAPWPTPRVTGNVLYIAGEGRASIRSRVRAWEKVHVAGLHAEGFFLTDPPPLITEKPEDFVAQALEASPEGYKLVVLDTISRAMQGTNENSQEAASSFTGLVDHLKYELGCTVIALHHTGKGEGTDYRGSSVFGGDADTILMAKRVNEKSYVVSVSMVKQKDAPHWEKPRKVKLREVILSSEEKSLVAVTADTSDTAEVSKEEKKEKAKGVREENNEFRAQEIEAAALKILRGNKAKSYSMIGLAKCVSHDLGGGLSSIRQTILPALGDNKESPLWHCWDPHGTSTKNWRWKPPPSAKE